ncbi:anti-sigma factor domain-containing protein [Paenibacillus thailandensis]|uniref:Anti-sigma factor domain-containing protein n=1 Tax=Paenibacillus thailandensis TaxID=393250 RepID=A0ABW5QWN2_9BACL
MLRRGVVMEVNRSHIIVMTADGQFVKAKLSGNPGIGEEIVYEPYAAKFAAGKSVWLSGSAAAIVLILIPLLLFVQRPHPVVAYLSMDVNPSIEIGVDEDRNVRELAALNEDGKPIIEGVDYKGRPVGDVVAAVMDRMVDAHYLDVSNKDIVITSVLLDEENSVLEQLESSITDIVNRSVDDVLAKATEQTGSANVVVLQAPTELRDAATELGVSSGKLAVYLIAKEEGYDIGLDSLKEASIDKVTENVGGVPAIVADSELANREGLKELVEKEGLTATAKEEGGTKLPAAPSTPAATATPASATAKPAKASTVKPAASPQANEDKGKGNNASKPAKPSKPDGSAKNGWKDWPNNNGNKNGGNNGYNGNNGWSGNKNNGANSSIWDRNDDGRNDDDEERSWNNGRNDDDEERSWNNDRNDDDEDRSWNNDRNDDGEERSWNNNRNDDDDWRDRDSDDEEDGKGDASYGTDKTKDRNKDKNQGYDKDRNKDDD